MEKDRARIKLVRNASLLGLLLLMSLGLFVFITFAGTKVPALALVPTATVDLQSTETPAAGTTTLAAGAVISATLLTTPGAASTPVSTISAGGADKNGCIPGTLEWTDPKPGSEIAGIVDFKGTANIPDFGFYYFEVSQDNTHWNKHSAGTIPVVNGLLGSWNTTNEIAGDYSIRLVVTDNKGQEMPPCVLQVKVKVQQ
jgi:hypothetical protein